MKLIFIRHAEPDYEHDSLTDKGWREARILAQRTAGWDVTKFYCSPLGRARATALFTLEQAGREAVTKQWLREFESPIIDPETGKPRIPWDLLPEVLNENPQLFDREDWFHAPALASGDMERNYRFVTNGIDGLLADYGYIRNGLRYQTMPDSQKEAVVVCFCHLGVICTILSHLLNMTPHQLWQGMFLAPTSVTIVGTEERKEGEVYFRCQTVGDVSHLLKAGEPISYYGSFTEPFQF